MSEQAGCCDAGAGLLRADLDVIALELARRGFAELWRGRAARPADLLPDDADQLLPKCLGRRAERYSVLDG